jgi:hypothetical protein
MARSSFRLVGRQGDRSLSFDERGVRRRPERRYFCDVAGCGIDIPSMICQSLPTLNHVCVTRKVKLVFVATEGIHGITLPDLGVNDVVNVGSTPSEIVVTPSKLGTFVAHCAVFCGAGHANMILTIKVVK